MEIYQKRQLLFNNQYNAIRSKYKLVGAIRLLVFLAIICFFYLALAKADTFYLYIVGGAVIAFLILLRIHVGYSWRMRYVQALKDVNRDELSFLEKDERPFEDGSEFKTTEHPYAFDLDIFGYKSLYQYLNRTATFIGKQKLADLLKGKLSANEILENQEAVKELSQKAEWRQEINAYSKLANLDDKSYQRLKKWSETEVLTISKFTRLLSYILPILLGVAIVLYFLLDIEVMGYVISSLFSINLIMTLSHIKYIQRELGGADKIHETIESCSAIIKRIEKESFVTEKMKSYISELNKDSFQASKELKELSRLFEQLETVANIFVMVVFNGFIQYHVHALYKFLDWKKEKGHLVPKSIEIIGEVEALNSLANFSYNNRYYTFPVISEEGKMSFTNLGHPLLNEKKRVCNDIDFSNQRFVILTGSNMSGKSTFLRTIGVNLVLAGIGAPICATKASFFPLPLFVSMRLTDSLEDSESYFYAEVKRLKMIIEQVREESCFVLLDEILRGTNSDDKQSGTIGVIHKLIRENTYGVIATHDLEVCETTNKFPDILINKCFEVEIKEDDLHFDYKIRDGVCQNKNATFIMRKMEIID
ncbi:DNA mismatch repair protein MutS [Myroides marinus]|uniref:DNA mismatch repair protein MutS n=1 Tax=Myroides marinus TaxID=703342 RepID=A0A161U8Q6_9FLAO|nr:DNA mismatch repair protein MutS [Myroides marinus]KZE82256.1 DNA mismatch repair protein MutS [Myroides marinus]MDM1350219.1 DNA mismatch repair protein MutS [Myroides marinus]MDM1357426.1 DNA mismatch repair protein MutS [Myroides marinus]MDM1364787.1 DNA mismatch repair protein MutS [Myroides marinus]MDM1370009.1 DNA mismatch repair protein MutS [Myroides marinus]